MSYIRVAEMLAGGIKYEVALHDHLRHNVYPPVPDFTQGASEAIDAVVAGEPDTPVRLPTGAEASAQEVVDGLRLGAFVDHRRQDDE